MCVCVTRDKETNFEMSDEDWSSSDEEKSVPEDRKRPLDESLSSPSPPRSGGADGDNLSSGKVKLDPDGEDDSNEENVNSPAKKKLKVSEVKRREKNFIDDEAEESGDDMGSGSEEEEDEDQYEDDGVIVMDGEDDEGHKLKRKKAVVEHKRLQRSRHITVADDDDLELIRDNMQLGIQHGNRVEVDDTSAEIVPERVNDTNLSDDEEDEDDERAVSLNIRRNRYMDDYDNDEMKGFIEDDDDEDEKGVEDEQARERRRKLKEQER